MSFKDAIAKKAQGIQAKREVKENKVNFTCKDVTIEVYKEGNYFKNGEIGIKTSSFNLGDQLTKIGAVWQIASDVYFMPYSEESFDKLKHLIGDFEIEVWRGKWKFQESLPEKFIPIDELTKEEIEEKKATVKLAPWIDETDPWQKYKAQVQALEEYLNIDLPAIQLRAIDSLYRETIGSDKLN